MSDFNYLPCIAVSALVLAISYASSGQAREIANCGESAGYGAYLSNGNLGPQGNFIEDSFSGSRVVLEAEEDPDTGKTSVDVIFHQSGVAYRSSEACFVVYLRILLRPLIT